MGHTVLSFKYELFENLPDGVHYIELVKDGLSEVLTVVKATDNRNSALSIIQNATPQKTPDRADVSVNTNAGGNVISQSYTVKKKEDSESLNLKHLKIRYYYTREGDKEQSFHCDNAAINMNKAPYYVDCSKMVKGTFKDGYMEISFLEDFELEEDALFFLHLSKSLND